jgi:hypothetical protein
MPSRGGVKRHPAAIWFKAFARAAEAAWQRRPGLAVRPCPAPGENHEFP